MKTRQKYIKVTLLAMAGLFASCHEDDFYDGGSNKGDALDLQAEIVQENVTRANDSGFADGDNIGVFVVNYADGKPQPLKLSGNHADNVRFTYDEAAGKWTGSYQLYWKDKSTSVDVYGYYPFDASMGSVLEYPFAVQRNQRDNLKAGSMAGFSGYEASDFLWAKAEGVNPTQSTITLRHKHMMAGVKVILMEGDGFADGEWSGLDKTVLVENTRLGASVNIADGVVSVNDTSTVASIIPQGSGTEYRAVIVPQVVDGGKSLFSLTVGGEGYRFIRPYEMTYHAGKLHRFIIQVNKKLPEGDYVFELIDEAITSWESDPLSHDGTAREYITVHVNEDEYIGDVIKTMGLDPNEIVNLKLTGMLSKYDHFWYIRQNMPNLVAVNLKELRTKMQTSFRWEGNGTAGDGWGVPPYEQPIYADDYLPMNAFENMSFLSYVVWPDSLKGIGDLAFAGTNLRGSLVFPDGMKHIGSNAFNAYKHQLNSLSGELYIPSTVEYIGYGAFMNCYFTGELVLPSRMKYLGADAFLNCNFMTGELHVPDGLDVVEKSFPSSFTGMAVIPQGVKTVNGTGGNPSSVFIPEGVEKIGFEAFWRMSSLRGDLHLPSTLRELSETSFAETEISHVNLPEGIEIIPTSCFSNCIYLQDTIVIPSTVTQIKSRAFENCRMLTAVILPEHLEEIQERAFASCRSLDYIQCLNPTPPVIAGNAFDGVEKNNFTLVVPEGAADAYRNADGWREFKRIAAYRNFVCRPMQAKLLNKSNTRKMILNADGNWTVTHCPSWAHVSAQEGFKKTELTVKIDELARGSGNRVDSIVFTLSDQSDEEGKSISAYYKISQFDSEYIEDAQHTLQKATIGKGINIVFTGDGYDAEDIAAGTFISDMKEGMEYFFAIEPYKTYKDYFNVYADIAMSYESGVCSSVNIWRDTKFDIIYGAGPNGRLSVDFDKIMAYVLQDVSGSAVTPQNVSQSLVICVPNSDTYEGVTCMYADGSAVAIVPHSRYDYPNDFRGLIQHEAGGHGFGKLGDEYVYHREYIQKCTCSCCAHVAHVSENKSNGWYRNLSLSGKYSDMGWSHLIFDHRYSDIVDIYEGGYMHARGIYRSEQNSCMNNNVPYYSTISRQAIVERILDYAGGTFDFETFVSRDSREMGDKFLTRSRSNGKVTAIHGNAPIVKKGTPMDYIYKSKLNSKRR